jgi:hypothetical protein
MYKFQLSIFFSVDFYSTFLRTLYERMSHVKEVPDKKGPCVPVILTANFGRLLGPVGTCSIFRTVSMPSITRPKTVCLPSKKSAGAVVMKNWKLT